VLLPLVVAAVAVFAWRWQHRGPERASVGGAIDRFRTSSTLSTPTARFQPRPGVYVYDGSGTESVSFLTTRQPQGPTEPGTVEPKPNGCWQFRLDFNSFHSETWNRCSTKQKLTESGGTTDQRFDFVAFKVGEHSEITCDPPFVVADPSAAPGTSAPMHCRGRSQTTKGSFTQTGTATLVGPETVTVEGVKVPALHTREDIHTKGTQNGDAHVDIWFALSNGLPLKETHNINIVSPAPAPINHVTYTERGNWQLTSMTPRT
jgi:hypothetical protein